MVELGRTEYKDGLGQLRRLEEEVEASDPPLTFEALYDYDQKDRLVSVRLLEPGSTTVSQDRSFLYSEAGFLVSSTEPERTTTYARYDALGNLLSETTGGVIAGETVTTAYQFDLFGRLRKKFVDGRKAAVFSYGDTVDETTPGDSTYGKVVTATQHNWFLNQSPNDVKVIQNWAYDGPGHRVSSRTTRLSCSGDAGQVFSIGYGYDTWGNIDSQEHRCGTTAVGQRLTGPTVT